MTTMNYEKLEAAAVARLAELPCPTCGGWGHHYRPVAPGSIDNERFPCPDCHGTGRRFWGLRRKEDPIPERGALTVRGWTVASPAEALHWLMGREEWEFMLTMQDGSPDPYQASWNDMKKFAATPLLALVAAIEAAAE